MPDLLNPGDQEALGAPPATTPPTTKPTKEEIEAAALKPKKTDVVSVFQKGKVGTMSAFLTQNYEAVLKQSAPKALADVKREAGLLDQWLASSPQGRYIREKCSIESIFAALLMACTSGLSLQFKDYAIIPYGGAVQFQVQYQGMIKMTRNYGEITCVEARAVYEGDEFDFCYGLNPQLHHRPSGSGGLVTHSYCVVIYKNGHRRFVVLSRSEIEALRKRNKSQGDAPKDAWATDYAEMACAKAIRRALKTEPASAVHAAAFYADGAEMHLSNEPNAENGLQGFVKAEFADE